MGSGRLFGDWNADEGLQLEWSEGDVWKASVPFGAGQHEFKVRDSHTTFIRTL